MEIQNMNTIMHPAFMMSFDVLMEGLSRECAGGNVYSRTDLHSGRTLYCYTKACVYNRAWNEFNVLARGLIVDLHEKRIIAAPFPKFFNWSEERVEIPDLPFDAYEKMDGSLAIIHHDGKSWRAATKGSLDSSQALWTEKRLKAGDTSVLVAGATYLAEAIYPENKIVIPYADEALVLLGAYRANGEEIPSDELDGIAESMDWGRPRNYHFENLQELLREAHGLPVTEEGFVIRYMNGLRIKVKGDEYCRVHAMISRCTPLAMWDAIVAKDNLHEIRKVLPEEFWKDFDNIISLLGNHLNDEFDKVAEVALSVHDLSDRELGMKENMDRDTKGLVFSYRKCKGLLEGRIKDVLLRRVRPSANVLLGYRPSYAMQRLEDEAA